MTRARDLANSGVSVGQGATQWSVVSSNYFALPSQGLFADSTNGSFTINLPTSPSTGDTIIVSDKAGKFSANPVSSGIEKIDGKDGPIILNIADASVVLVYTDSTVGWRLI